VSNVTLIEFHRDALDRTSTLISGTLSNRAQGSFVAEGRLMVVIMSPTAVQHLTEARIRFTQGG